MNTDIAIITETEEIQRLTLVDKEKNVELITLKKV